MHAAESGQRHEPRATAGARRVDCKQKLDAGLGEEYRLDTPIGHPRPW